MWDDHTEEAKASPDSGPEGLGSEREDPAPRFSSLCPGGPLGVGLVCVLVKGIPGGHCLPACSPGETQRSETRAFRVDSVPRRIFSFRFVAK